MKLLTRTGSNFLHYDFSIGTERFRGSTKRMITERKEAEAFLVKQYQEKLNQIQFGIKPEITIADAFVLALKRYNGSTLRVYDLARRKMIGMPLTGPRKPATQPWHFKATMPMSSLRQVHIESLLIARKIEGISAAGIGIELSVLSLTYNYIRRDYSATPDLTFAAPRAFVKTRYLTESEEQKVQAYLGSLTCKAAKDASDFMTFLIDTGVRLNEGAEAQWGDLDLTTGTFEVYRTKTKTISVVPLSQRVLTLLQKRHNQPQPFGKLVGAQKHIRDGLNLVCNQNQRINEQRGRATIHSLRDTYATRLLKNGLSLYELTKLLGHTQASMSEKYAHLETGDVVGKARRLMSAQN